MIYNKIHLLTLEECHVVAGHGCDFADLFANEAGQITSQLFGNTVAGLVWRVTWGSTCKVESVINNLMRTTQDIHDYFYPPEVPINNGPRTRFQLARAWQL